MPELNQSLFLKACRREAVPRPPVWMMRQAGRYLPEYRAVRQKVDFISLCRTPDLAAEVTLQPIDILGVDAAVIFSDILVVPEAMGIPVTFEERGGPKLARRIATAGDVESLVPPDPASDLSYVGEAIRRVRRSLEPRGIPVLGFAGAPFTLAAYMIEGETSRDFTKTRRALHADPVLFRRLLGKIADAVGHFLRFQIESGASAVQIFDTWAGLLGQETFRTFALPAIARAIDAVKGLGAPVILYVNGSAQHIESMAHSGADVISVDWRLSLDEVRRRSGDRVGIQGNLDPAALYAPPDRVRESTAAMLARHPGPGLVANLGHGLFPDTPVEGARAFVDTIREWSA